MRWRNFAAALLLVLLAAASATAQESQGQANYNSCLGGYSYRCNPGLLTDAQQVKVRQAAEAEKSLVSSCAENGSCYGDISEATGRPKTVHVSGYYRSDGTYVRGHYRSRPRR